MPVVPNPNNGYIPKVGEYVRIVGGCLSRLLGKIVEVVNVYDHNGETHCDCRYFNDHPKVNDWVIAGGLCGGLEPIEVEK